MATEAAQLEGKESRIHSKNTTVLILTGLLMEGLGDRTASPTSRFEVGSIEVSAAEPLE
jgi:hypothetical protein